jgi:hypothetical protein
MVMAFPRISTTLTGALQIARVLRLALRHHRPIKPLIICAEWSRVAYLQKTKPLLNWCYLAIKASARQKVVAEKPWYAAVYLR